jgi:hypothetical protein
MLYLSKEPWVMSIPVWPCYLHGLVQPLIQSILGPNRKSNFALVNIAHFYFLLDRPGMFDMIGKAKWNAWEAKKGIGRFMLDCSTP